MVKNLQEHKSVEINGNDVGEQEKVTQANAARACGWQPRYRQDLANRAAR